MVRSRRVLLYSVSILPALWIPSFGDGGRRTYGRDFASSVALDSDGRIVVAGVDGSNLVVLRLMQNGELDATFADSGIFTGAALAGVRPRILPVDTGGYRVLVHDAAATFAKCRVLALTAAGAVDESFGVLGYADLASTALVSNCNSIVRSSAGRLLVAGSNDDRAFVLRLMADGKVDTGFDAGAITATMTSASAVGGGADDSVLVAGRGPRDVAGVPVVRLHADGSLDTQFGNGGTTWIDLPSGGLASAHDLAVLPGGDIVVVGGAIQRVVREAVCGSTGGFGSRRRSGRPWRDATVGRPGAGHRAGLDDRSADGWQSRGCERVL